jgi:hypothetical protein
VNDAERLRHDPPVRWIRGTAQYEEGYQALYSTRRTNEGSQDHILYACNEQRCFNRRLRGEKTNYGHPN